MLIICSCDVDMGDGLMCGTILVVSPQYVTISFAYAVLMSVQLRRHIRSAHPGAGEHTPYLCHAYAEHT